MAHVELIPLQAQDTWGEALRGIPHSFHHTWDYAHAMHRTTGYPTFLYCVRDATARIACPLVEREFAGYVDVATPSGLSGFVGTGSWSQFASHWQDFVHTREYVSGYVGLHPLFVPPELGEDARQHNSIYVLDLDLGRERLLRRMDQNRRRQLRGWDERASRFVLDQDAISEFLVASYEPFMRRVQARAPHLAAETLDLLCRCESCIAVGTPSSPGLDAVAVFAATPYAGDFVLNVATQDGRRRATDLLWYGVRALIDRKVPVLNLGGGAREDDEIARAKQRWRPRRLPLLSLRQVYRPDAYAELCRLGGVNAAAAGDYFPAYRSPVAKRDARTAT